VRAFVTRYSGVTARDLHPFPYSPSTVVEGTLFCFLQDIEQSHQHIVGNKQGFTIFQGAASSFFLVCC